MPFEGFCVFIRPTTPEELVCQQETLDEILAVLALCTEKQRERFLLYALYDFSYEEIAEREGQTAPAACPSCT